MYVPETRIELARPFELPRDFKSLVSTYSTIPARQKDLNILTKNKGFGQYMFTDTHCHLSMMQEREINLIDFFKDYYDADEKDAMLVDIGTKADDFLERQKIKELAEEAVETSSFLYFSAGIWPSKEDADNYKTECTVLENILKDHAHKDICALGECGFDRRENPVESGKEHLAAEEELFACQVELAKKYNLPLIVHSRDAFEETHGVLKNGNHDKVVIHCYSYDKQAARAFLDLGCYISFSGTITFGKKAQNELNAELLNYVPKDLLLLETDAPYLAPMPFRGKTNTPLLIEHTYAFVAESLQMETDSLKKLINFNAKRFFS